MESLLILFILLQPFIDLLTSLSILVLEINLTFGVFIRFGVMFLICIYILMSSYKHKKAMILYLILFAGILLVGLVSNYFVKDPISLFAELQNVAKVVYFPILLFGYLIVFDKIKKNEKLKRKVQTNIFYSMLVISIVMVLAVLTNTEILSYESNKLGHQGWFFAGNELGAILGMSFGLVVYFVIMQTTSWKKVYLWIPVGLMMFSLLELGTKVGYGAILIILMISLIMTLVGYVKNRKNQVDAKPFKINMSVNILFLILFALYTPFTPVAFNLNVHIDWVDLNEPHKGSSLEEEDERKKKAVENIVFSGREDFLKMYQSAYRDAPVIQKLFGMGDGGNNVNEGHPIEMDFYDLFFSLGIIGFLAYLLPIIYYAYQIIVALVKNFREKFNLETALVGASIVLGIGVAFTAGHVLTAPAASIYLAILVAYLYQMVCVNKDIT